MCSFEGCAACIVLLVATAVQLARARPEPARPVRCRCLRRWECTHWRWDLPGHLSALSNATGGKRRKGEERERREVGGWDKNYYGPIWRNYGLETWFVEILS